MPASTLDHPTEPSFVASPAIAVSVLLQTDDRVLLVRRSRPPFKDTWAFPGGKVKFGERLADAARREILEETGIAAGHLEQIDIAEIVDRNPDGAAQSHYVVVVFRGAADRAAAAAAGDDAAEARWVPTAEAERLPLTPDTARILRGLRSSGQRGPQP